MSTRVIKAHARNPASVGDVFNFVDVQQQGEEMILSARQTAETILSGANGEAQQIRQQVLEEARTIAREEAFRDAASVVTQQAIAIAEQRVSAQLATALPALRSAAESLQLERDRWLTRWEQIAVNLGVAIAEKLLQRQLAMRPELALTMISDALRLAAGQPRLTVYLHPDDLAAWGDRGQQIVQSLTACAETSLVADPLCGRGGCRIETRHGEIDARIETMLQRIAEELVNE